MGTIRVSGVKNMFFLLFLYVFSLSMEFSKAQMVPAVYVLGDSQVDVGNNNFLPVSFAKADFRHNGIDFPTGKPTGRFCNGKNAADLLAEKVGLPTSPPYFSLLEKDESSYMKGVSFASGGAGIFNSTGEGIFHSKDQVFRRAVSLSQQVENYQKVQKILVQQMEASAAGNHISKSLFAVVIGGNDLMDYFGSSELRNNHTPQQFVDLMVNTLKGQLKRLYSFGARKFLISDVPPIGCLPAARVKSETHECNEEHNFWTVKYNQGLREMLNGLKSELQGIKYSYFNIYQVVTDVIQNPSAHGFKEVKSACCGLGELRADIPCVPISKFCFNRKDHVFWDLYHPTEATVRIVVDAIFDGSSKYCVPMNVRQLVSS